MSWSIYIVQVDLILYRIASGAGTALATGRDRLEHTNVRKMSKIGSAAAASGDEQAKQMRRGQRPFEYQHA